MAKLHTLILTLLGADRPGLVELLARETESNGGNWVESRMCRLGGQFAGILRIEVPPANAAPLRKALERAAGDDLRMGIHLEERQHPAPKGTAADLDLVGQDRPGIVHEIARALAARRVNVEEMTSGCESAPMSGERLFRAHFRVVLPPGCRVSELRSVIDKIANDLVVDVQFAPAE